MRLYRARRYFDAHEAWETLWLAAAEPEKTFLQALIQVTAAFHHLERGNVRGAGSLFERALRRLEPFPASFGGVSVGTLRQDLRDRLALLDKRPTGVQLTPVRVQPAEGGWVPPA